MPRKTERIHGKMPARPEWLVVNSTISFTITRNEAKKLSAAILEFQAAPYTNIEVHFTGGLEVALSASADLP